MTVHVQPTGMCPASHLHLIPSNVREAVAALGHEPHARALNTGVSGTCGTTTAVSVAGIYDGEDHYVYMCMQSRRAQRWVAGAYLKVTEVVRGLGLLDGTDRVV